MSLGGLRSAGRAHRDAWRDRHAGRPVTFTLDGVTYTVPTQPARVWVLAVLSDDPADVLLDALPEPVAAGLWDDAMDPECGVTVDLLARIGRAVLGEVAHRPWWAASQLIGTLIASWPELSGRAADRGLGDPLDWPLPRLCDWVYARLVDGVEEREREAIDRTLDHPLGVDVHTAPAAPDGDGWEDEAEGFLQMIGVQAAGGAVG